MNRSLLATSSTTLRTTPSTSSSATTRRRTLRAPIWRAPLRPGKLPAFDEALKYIRADATVLRAQIRDLKATPHVAPADHDRYREKLRVLRIQSEINLPEVRYAFTTGRFPFTRPVYRHLAEQKWRTDGPLDLLMERLHQMHVVPDLLPALHPDIDLRVQFPSEPTRQTRRTAHDRARENAAYSTVEPGGFLPVAQTLNAPRIAATVFHDDLRLYTLLMLDPDVPDESTGSYTTFLHWMQPNIPLSAARRISRIALSPAAAPLDPALHAHPAFLPLPSLPYIPPHPARGTAYHRYVLLMLRQPRAAESTPASEPDSEIQVPPPARLHFDLRAFLRAHGMDAVGKDAGGGGHMWRAVWTAEEAGVVSGVWAALGTPEPRYGRPPRVDPYSAMKGRRRYTP